MAAVLIHGRDQDEQVMLDVARRLALPDVAYLLPVAAGNTWYAGRYFDPLADNQPQVDWALETFEAALATVAAGGRAGGSDRARRVLPGRVSGRRADRAPAAAAGRGGRAHRARCSAPPAQRDHARARRRAADAVRLQSP